MQSEHPFLSVIIPAYNEQHRIANSLTNILAYLDTQPFTFELVIVNDGSCDATEQVIQAKIHDRANARLISYAPNRGKGYAIRQGVSAAQGEFISFLDADLSTPIETLEPALRHLQNGSDIVIGSRALADSQIAVYQPLYRRIASKIFNVVRDMIIGSEISRFKDTQCGFKAYRGPVARQLYQHAKVDRFMFDVEILYLAMKFKCRVFEIPVRWADVPGSKVGFAGDALRMFKDLLAIRLMHRNVRKDV